MSIMLSVRCERWPIAGAFAISRGSKTEAEVVVAELTDGPFTGRGECTPYPRYGETVAGVAAAIASSHLIWIGGFFWHWLQSWAVAWIVMLPVVIVAAPAILRLSELMTCKDAAALVAHAPHVLSSESASEASEISHAPPRPDRANTTEGLRKGHQ